LNGTLVANGDADDSVLFLPDGNFVVYWAEEQTDTVNSLVLADITGGAVNSRTRLNVRGAIIDRASLSPLGDRLFFVSDDDITDARELYVVDLTAPVRRTVKVNPDFPNNTYDVASARWSPDGLRIAYAADQANGSQVELFVVDAPGLVFGSPERANPAFTLATSNVDGNPVDGYGWSADGTRIALIADATADEVFDLWVADVTLSPPVASRVSPVLPANSDVIDFLFSPSGARLVYRADQNVDARDELFYSDVSGMTPGAPQRVNSALPAGGSVVSGPSELRWSANSQTIYYRADQVTDNVFEMFGVSVATGSPGVPFMLHGVLPLNGDVNLSNVQQP
jgi:Tol biopolymer transport system component